MAGQTPDVSINFRATGLDGVRRGLKVVRDEAEPTGRQWGHASRQIAGGLEQVARSGKVTGESLKQIISQGSEMAFMFGKGGPIVAAIGILGVAIYEGITGRMKEARAEARAVQEEIAGAMRSKNLPSAGETAQRLFSGDKFAVQREDEGDKAFEARQLGVMGLRNRLTSLGEYRRKDEYGAHGEVLRAQSGPSYEALQLIKEYTEQLKKYEERARAAGVAVDSLSAAEGKRIATAAATTLAERERAWRVADAPGNARFNSPYANDRFRYIPGMFDSIGGDPRNGAPMLDMKVLHRTNLLDPSKKTSDMVEGMKAVGEMAGKGFVDTLSSTIEAGMAKAFEKGANIGTIFAAMGETALAGLGGVAVSIGRYALAQFAFIKTIGNAIAGLSPAIGIPAALGLITLGSAVGGAGHRIGANAAGAGGGGYGAYGASNGYGASIIDRGIIDPTRGAGVSSSRVSGNTFNFVGTRDPNIVRQFQEVIAQIGQRGRA